MGTGVSQIMIRTPKIVNRWIQMVACIIAMMAIANLQYAWTLFTKPLTSSLHVTLAAKWFPDRRGLTAGIVSGAYGIGTAVTVAPIERMIKSSGYQHTFIFWGLLQGIIVFVAAMFIVAPAKGWLPASWKPNVRVAQSVRDMTVWEMLRQPSFYVIYIMMTMVAFGGLVVTSQLKEIAGFYKVDRTIIAWGLSVSILAIQLNRVVNGLTRPLWGWISDHIGRENAMFTAFLIEGLAIWAWLQTISRPVWFVLLSSLVFFAWGEIFSLFPSITADLFGRRWATTNYGVVYTAKGTASIFSAPVAAYVMLKTGSWIPIFYVMIVCDILAAFMALLWLKPVARRTITAAMLAEEAAKEEEKRELVSA